MIGRLIPPPPLVRRSACTYEDTLNNLYNRLKTAEALSKKTNKSDGKTIDSRSV